MTDAIAALDTDWLRAVMALPHPGWAVAVAAAASVAGIGGGIWLGLGVLLAGLRRIRWRDVAVLVVAIALVHLVVDVVVKPWVDRPRPPLTLAGLEVAVAVPGSASFPSGHAANAAAGALVLACAWRRGRLLLVPLAVLVGGARVYLGVHYPLDAVAGAAVGLAVGWLVLRAARPATN